MTVRLRLQRTGKLKRPYYKVVAIDKRKKRDGKPIEVLGNYDPMIKNNCLMINDQRFTYWIKVGATVSKRLNDIISRKKNENQ